MKNFKQHILEKLKISNHKGLSPKDTVYVCNFIYKFFEQESDKKDK